MSAQTGGCYCRLVKIFACWCRLLQIEPVWCRLVLIGAGGVS